MLRSCKDFFEVLQLAQHRNETEFVVSEHVYGIEDEMPLMRSGQVNDNAMCLWTLDTA